MGSDSQFYVVGPTKGYDTFSFTPAPMPPPRRPPKTCVPLLSLAQVRCDQPQEPKTTRREAAAGAPPLPHHPSTTSSQI
jgi:hypothetical protein